ncbi:hypothetical protein IAT40_003210 [Kwoniella sp. CBS 6097]
MATPTLSAEAGPSTPPRQSKSSRKRNISSKPPASSTNETTLANSILENEGLGDDGVVISNAGPSSSPSPSPKVSKKQTVDQLKDGLAQMGLDTKGKKETLWRRLVNAIHKASLRDPPSDDDSDYFIGSDTYADETSPSSSSPTATKFNGKTKSKDGLGEGAKVLKQPYKSFLCFDVEATCRPGKEFDWPNEIIEFPVVLLRWTEPDTNGKRKLEKVDHFRSYVRPIWKPILSDFCKDLTGITQETVDASPTFPEMLKKLEKWMDKWDLRTDKGLNDAIWVTDGPWDLRDFVPKQLHITPPSPHPQYFHGPYLNLKFAVQAVLSEEHRRYSYASERPNKPTNGRALSAITTQRLPKGEKTKSGKVKDVGKSFYFNIPGMVAALDLGEFEGRQHSGLDDATNIARILIALSEKNVVIEANGIIQPISSGRRYPWMGKKGEVLWEDWMSTNQELGPPTSRGVKEAREAMNKDRATKEDANEIVGVDRKDVEEGLAKLALAEDEFVHVGSDIPPTEAKNLNGKGESAVARTDPTEDPVKKTTKDTKTPSILPTVEAATVQLAPPIETPI